MRRVKKVFAAAAAALATSAPVSAAVFVVNSTADALGDGVAANCTLVNRASPPDLNTQPAGCRLRDAIAAANANEGADEIVINLAGTPVVTLLSTLEIEESVDINAPPLPGQQIFTAFILRASAGVTDLILVNDGETELGNLLLENGDLDIAAGNLVFERTTDATFAENIGGAGMFEKSGAATLILTGTNDYSGGTLVSQGTLQGDTLALQGDITIATGAKLTFDQGSGDPAAFTGVLAGPGSIEKIGDGLLDLQTPSTFTGTTTISAGTLQGFVSMGGSSLRGDIINNAELIFLQAADGTFEDDISGNSNGTVVKDGPGTLTLTGSNSFGGGLEIAEGIVIGDADAIPGNVAIGTTGGAQLIFDQADTDTHAGNISGGIGALPSVIKRGAGELTLAGNNSFAGDLVIQAGTLIGSTGSIPGDVVFDAPSTLVLSQASNGSFDGVLAGPGTLIKRGSGAVSLTRTQLLDATAVTTIEAGTLAIGVAGEGDGSGTTLPGDVVVNPGATLAGVGMVDDAVTANGTVAPGGGTAGTLRVGSISFGASSVLSVNVAEAGSDLLEVGGNATLTDGAVIQVAFGSLDRSMDFTIPVLDAGGTVTGPLFDLSGSSAFFDTTVIAVGADVVALQLIHNGATLPDFAQTPNQRAVGEALEQAFAAPHDPDLDEVFGALGGLPVEEQRKALDDMAGEQLTEFATARLAISDRFQASLHERVRGVAWRDGEALISQQAPGRAPVIAAHPLVSRALPGFASGVPAPVAFAGQSMSSVLDSATGFGPGPGELGIGGWLDGYGLFGTLDGSSGSADLDYLIGGVSLGADYRIADNWLIGVAGGYAHSELDFDQLSGDQSAETGQGALYAGYVSPTVQIGASGRFGYSAMSASREIEFVDRDTDADFDGFDAGARVEAAVDLFQVRGVEIQPLASFSYTHVQQDEIEESGAGTLDLTADEETIDSLLSGVGARVHGVIRIDEKLWFHPELRARWTHEFGDTDRRLDAQIGGEPGAIFRVQGGEVPADAGVVGVSWTLVSAGRLHAFLDYDVTLAPELIQHGAAVGFKFVW